jgi:hypothetical protein
MARPQVAEGDGLQIWRVAANILNKQSRRADKGWSSSFGVGVGSTTHHKKISLLRNVTKVLGLGSILWLNDLRLVSDIKGGRETDGIREQGAKKNVWTEEDEVTGG